MRPVQSLPAACALLLLLLPGAAARADVGQLPIRELHQQTWTTRAGIPHNTINAIAQTPDGYLWIATWEGIARFNGHHFRIFDRSPETGLPDAGILSLSVGHDGRLLAAGARGGLSLTDGLRWQPLPPAPTMITHALIDQRGGLWMATQGAGVIHRPDPRLEDDVAYLPDASASQLLEHDSGIWAATSEGLLHVAESESTLIGATHGLPPVPALSLLVDGQGRLLVGTEQGLYVRAAGELNFRSLDRHFDGLAVSALMLDDSEALWLGTINSGLFRRNDEGITHLGTAAGLPNNRVLSIYQDPEQSLWVGTNGGLFRLRSAPFVTLTRQSGLAGNFVRAVLARSNGSLWAGTSEGVSRITATGVEPVTDGGEPLRQSTLSLEELDSGEVLIGTHSHGVLRWRDGTITARYDRSSGLPSNDVRFIHADRHGSIWIATASGLARLQDGSMRVYLPEHGLPGDFIIAVHEDRQGTLWVGTGFGLARLDPSRDRFEPISLYHLDQAMYVYGIHEDRSDPLLWLATDRGIVRYHTGSGQADLIGRAAGLPVDKFFHVIDDRHGGFWLTSNQGVVRIDRGQVVAAADGRIDQVEFELYAEGDGLLSAQANGGAGPAAAWHDGRVWVATAAGLASADPKHLTRYEDTVLPVSIEQFEADGRPVLLDEPLRLPPGTSRVAIQYAGLGFIMPQRIRYRTLLEGFDAQWVERRNQSVAEYTNLGPGDYVFRVSAAYPYGSWNGSEASIRFVIAPLPWQRTWFWLVTLLFAGGLVVLLTRWRLHRLQQRASELRLQVNEKTRALKRQAEDFERQARIDQLTGLANRRAFDEWLAAEFRRSRLDDEALSLVVMDLDHFKQINDGYSHLVGDEVMKRVAELLRDHIRIGDQAARWGGEEFTLTFRATDSRRAAIISERIRVSIEHADFESIAPGLKITASFGVSDNRQAASYESMLQQADQALYRAKSEGRNRVVEHARRPES